MKFLAILFLTATTVLHAQDGTWDVYLAQYEEGPGSTILDMSLITTAPSAGLPFLVITGVESQRCDDSGFPNQEEFDMLYEISDGVNRVIASATKKVHAGTFTHQCSRLDYIYVADTLNLRQRLGYFYKGNFKTYKHYITIEPDERWEAYTDFLYPNEETREYMENQKVLDHLTEEGDNLEKARLVDHWLYFASASDRDKFIRYAEGQKFKVEGKEVIKDNKLPYQLHIIRSDHVDSESINTLTITLRRKAAEFGGEYDGWESVVVKD